MGRNEVGPYVDLHVHTWYSDSSLSPAQVVEQALRAGVGLLAVADHEGFDGALEAAPLCEQAGIRFIPAAELECEHEGVHYHVLCYGADLDDVPLRARAARSRAALDGMSDELIARMARDYPALDPGEFATFIRDPARGGWKGLEYLMRRGVTTGMREGMAMYARYGVSYEDAGFPTLHELIGQIHRAHGRAVLAHPGYTLRGHADEDIIAQAAHLLEYGLDGLECYYPLHAPALTGQLVELARERSAMITAGSDCHGTFGGTRVGQMNITQDKIDLRGL